VTPGRPFDLQAHRGGAGLWPENTLEAFGRAGSASSPAPTSRIDGLVGRTSIQCFDWGVLARVHGAEPMLDRNGDLPHPRLALPLRRRRAAPCRNPSPAERNLTVLRCVSPT
jgi:hypothetical protein